MIQDKLDNYRKERIQSENTLRYLTNELLDIVKNKVKIGSFYKTSGSGKIILFKAVEFSEIYLVCELIQITTLLNYIDQSDFEISYSKEHIFKADTILGDILEIEEELFNQYKSIALFLQDAKL